jgi:hypothetical protein
MAMRQGTIIDTTIDIGSQLHPYRGLKPSVAGPLEKGRETDSEHASKQGRQQVVSPLRGAGAMA